jgi:hypothetical protein
VVLVDQSMPIGDGAPVVAMTFEQLQQCARPSGRPMSLDTIGFLNKAGDPIKIMDILNAIDWSHLIHGGSREAAMPKLIHEFNARTVDETSPTTKPRFNIRRVDEPAISLTPLARRFDDAVLQALADVVSWFNSFLKNPVFLIS